MFETTKAQDDILIKDVFVSKMLEKLEKRPIFNIEILFVNETFQSYNQELLYFVDCVSPPEEETAP